MRLIYFLIVLTICIPQLHAQSNQFSYFLINKQPIDTNRYANIKGSPYLFKHWVKGRVISKRLLTFEDVRLNYNGHTHFFEIRNGDSFIELDRIFYLRIEVHKKDNPEYFPDEFGDVMIFQANMHPKFKDRLVNVFYAGKRISLIRDFKAKITEWDVKSPRTNRKSQRFKSDATFYLLKNESLIMLRLKKKQILKALGNKKEIEDFVDTHKIDLGSVEGLLKVLAFYEDKDL